MEVQEKIEECESKEQMIEIKNDLIERITNDKQDLELAFEKEDLDKALGILKHIKFHLTILEQLNEKL